jgi:hypothetical protein
VIARSTQPNISSRKTLGAVIRQVHDQCDGDLSAGKREFERIVEELWPKTIKDEARKFWDRHRPA